MDSSATLPRDRQAMRKRKKARQVIQQPQIDPTFAHIAEALQPEESATGSRVAVFTALGAIFGFAAAWLTMKYLGSWYVVAPLGTCVGAFLGMLTARLTAATSDWTDS